MDEDKTPRLFVSHHSSKLDIALRVEAALARHGVACWIAPRDVDPGEAFDTAITSAIDDSAAVLLLFCSQSDKSRHVKRELILADSARKAIIPLRLEDIIPHDLAYHLASAQWIDGVDERDDALARIAAKTRQLAAIDGGGGRKAASDAASAPAESPDDLHAQLVAAASTPDQAATEVGASPVPTAPASISVRTLMLFAALIAIVALSGWLALRGGETAPSEPVLAATSEGPSGDDDAAITAEIESAASPAAIPAQQDAAPASQPAGTHIPPSFNCAKASTRAEIMICGNEELALLDRELNRAYVDLRKVVGPNRQELEIDQRGWRLAERDICADADCLAHTMRRRILELNEDRLSVLKGGDL